MGLQFMIMLVNCAKS